MIVKILFVLSLLCGSIVHAQELNALNQNPILRYLAASEPLRDLALYSIITKRCSLHLEVKKVAPCEEAVAVMLDEMDHDMIATSETSFIFVSFKTDLLTMISDSRTTAYLKKINNVLNLYLTSRAPFNLWQETLTHFQNEESAARALAVLFQDTGVRKLHLEYLNHVFNHPSPTQQENHELLSMVIETMNLITEYAEGNVQDLFYPSEVEKTFNPSLYHFYLPLSLSYRLLKKKIYPEMSYTAPLFMTLTYEFVTMAEDGSYLFRDPEVLSVEHQWKLRDIFAGHSGAAFAVKKRPTAFKDLQIDFAKSVKTAVGSLKF